MRRGTKPSRRRTCCPIAFREERDRESRVWAAWPTWLLIGTTPKNSTVSRANAVANGVNEICWARDVGLARSRLRFVHLRNTHHVRRGHGTTRGVDGSKQHVSTAIDDKYCSSRDSAFLTRVADSPIPNHLLVLIGNNGEGQAQLFPQGFPSLGRVNRYCDYIRTKSNQAESRSSPLISCRFRQIVCRELRIRTLAFGR